METAPLSLAYTHARNAVSEQQKTNPIAASEEHDLAAGEFANAAKSTGDPEALRILKLLEQHHQQIAELLKFKPEPGPTVEEEVKVLATVPEGEVQEKPRVKLSKTGTHRELSTSIASNLASARGIQPRQRPRGQASTTLSATNADGRMSNDESAERRSRGHNRRPPPLSSSTLKSKTAGLGSPAQGQIPPSVVHPGSDDAFTRFYSTVETLGTKLSAALAFTGLPLSAAEEAQAEPEKRPRVPVLSKETSRTTPSGSPDVSRFFSRAALKAVRDETGAGVTESFYVVPTSGGTVSYRDMLSATGQRQSSGLSNVDEAEEFVDAREAPGSGSVEKRPRSRASTKGHPDENADLINERNHWKALAMETGERLRAFEMNAQRESIMHASMFRSRPSSPGLKRDGLAQDTTELEGRLAEAEVLVERGKEEVHRLVKENRKLEAVCQKYRKKFDELKDHAKERLKREEERERASAVQ